MHENEQKKNHGVKILYVWIRGDFLLHNQGEIIYTLGVEVGVGMSRHLD